MLKLLNGERENAKTYCCSKRDGGKGKPHSLLPLLFRPEHPTPDLTFGSPTLGRALWILRGGAAAPPDGILGAERKAAQSKECDWDRKSGTAFS